MAKTIYTYLHNDDLGGSRVVNMDNCFCKLYKIQRTDGGFLQSFKDELQKPALYVLLNYEKDEAYIGETDSFYTRIQQHISRKGFWLEALAFTASDDSLSKTEVQYLEYLAYEKAHEVKVYDLSENTQTPKEPHMTIIQKNKTKEFFKYVQFLTKFVGCDIFEKKKTKGLHEQLDTTITIQDPPIDEKEITTEDLKGKVSICVNGGDPFNKACFGYAIVKEYLNKHRKTSIQKLKEIFNKKLLGSWSNWKMIEDDLEYAEDLKKTSGKYRHQTNPRFILTSGDNVKFVVSSQWDYTNIPKLIQFAKEQGWEVKINESLA